MKRALPWQRSSTEAKQLPLLKFDGVIHYAWTPVNLVTISHVMAEEIVDRHPGVKGAFDGLADAEAAFLAKFGDKTASIPSDGAAHCALRPARSVDVGLGGCASAPPAASPTSTAPAPRTYSPCIVGFDMEWKASFTKGVPPSKVALIQVHVHAGSCFLFQILSSQCGVVGVPPALLALITSSDIIKTGVNIDGDAQKLRMDYKIAMAGVADANKVLLLKHTTDRFSSLAALCARFLGKDLCKDAWVRMSDWEVSPLSSQQILYAATDAYASLALYNVIAKYVGSPTALPVTLVAAGSDDGPTVANSGGGVSVPCASPSASLPTPTPAAAAPDTPVIALAASPTIPYPVNGGVSAPACHTSHTTPPAQPVLVPAGNDGNPTPPKRATPAPPAAAAAAAVVSHDDALDSCPAAASPPPSGCTCGVGTFPQPLLRTALHGLDMTVRCSAVVVFQRYACITCHAFRGVVQVYRLWHFGGIAVPDLPDAVAAVPGALLPSHAAALTAADITASVCRLMLAGMPYRWATLGVPPAVEAAVVRCVSAHVVSDGPSAASRWLFIPVARLENTLDCVVVRCPPLSRSFKLSSVHWCGRDAIDRGRVASAHVLLTGAARCPTPLYTRAMVPLPDEDWVHAHAAAALPEDCGSPVTLAHVQFVLCHMLCCALAESE